MSITLTPAAASHVQRSLVRRGKGLGVRLGIKTTGCSGLAYKIEYVDEVSPEDQVIDVHGVKVVIDPKSLAYLDGTELDYVREGLNEGFRFTNPNERDRCGCGESFRVEKYALLNRLVEWPPVCGSQASGIGQSSTRLLAPDTAGACCGKNNPRNCSMPDGCCR